MQKHHERALGSGFIVMKAVAIGRAGFPFRATEAHYLLDGSDRGEKED
jgi:hypothetical protein